MIRFRPDATHDRSLSLALSVLSVDGRSHLNVVHEPQRFNATSQTLRRSLFQRQWTVPIRGRAYLASHFRFLVPRHKAHPSKTRCRATLGNSPRREIAFVRASVWLELFAVEFYFEWKINNNGDCLWALCG